MALEPAFSAHCGPGWSMLTGLVANDGSGRHPMCRRLALPSALARDVTDTIHALGMLHGRQPGVLDHAAARNSHDECAAWLDAAVDGFAAERALLAKLASAAGPLPSTPGQAESEATILAQRHALNTLAQSDRDGCALGAAVALVLDWAAMRDVLVAAAERLGIDVRPGTLPVDQETATIVAAVGERPAAERAMAFGAQQVLAQHRGLWDLLEARAVARNQA
ncbi:MAG: hypothetical protein K2Y20_05010 [Sphingomonas sp.]|nr:hypothetical protein [Sphingomonas sp.]